MSRTLRIRLLTLAAALLAALSITACGGDDEGGDNGEDPAEVLQATFSNEQAVDSGTFDLSLDISAEGDQGGSIEAELSGPFQSRDGDIPAFDVSGDLKADTPLQDFDFSGGLSTTGQAAFVEFDDTSYAVPQELFDEFAQSFVQLQQQSEKENAGAGGSLFSSLGIEPTSWLTNLENEGTEEVGGAESIHISGDADVPKLVEDLQTIAEKGPASGQVSPDQLSQLESVVEEAHFDIYSGLDDKVLRRISASLDLAPPPGTPGGTEAVSLDFSFTLGDINEPQTIAAPESAEPLETLFQQFGLDSGALGEALGGGALPQAGGEPAAPSGDATEAYLQCLQQATDAAATQACSELLQ